MAVDVRCMRSECRVSIKVWAQITGMVRLHSAVMGSWRDDQKLSSGCGPEVQVAIRIYSLYIRLSKHMKMLLLFMFYKLKMVV